MKKIAEIALGILLIIGDGIKYLLSKNWMLLSGFILTFSILVLLMTLGNNIYFIGFFVLAVGLISYYVIFEFGYTKYNKFSYGMVLGLVIITGFHYWAFSDTNVNVKTEKLRTMKIYDNHKNYMKTNGVTINIKKFKTFKKFDKENKHHFTEAILYRKSLFSKKFKSFKPVVSYTIDKGNK